MTVEEIRADVERRGWEAIRAARAARKPEPDRFVISPGQRDALLIPFRKPYSPVEIDTKDLPVALTLFGHPVDVVDGAVTVTGVDLR